MLSKIANARRELAKRAKSPMVKAAQLDGALQLVDEAIAEIDSALRVLAVAVTARDAELDVPPEIAEQVLAIMDPAVGFSVEPRKLS